MNGKIVQSNPTSDHRISKSNSCKRFLNIFQLYRSWVISDKLFQDFGGGEVPLLATFSHLGATFLISKISRVLSIVEGSGFNQDVRRDAGNNFVPDNFFVR